MNMLVSPQAVPPTFCNKIAPMSRIDICMKVVQARQATLDAEVANVQERLKDLVEMRNNWQAVWNEVTTVASNLDIEIKLSSGRRLDVRRHVSVGNGKESFPEACYMTFIFYAIIDNVIGGQIVCCNVVKRIKRTI